ncbi:zinc-binding dehydrogenase [Rhodococcus erythropolis]|uniref:zinc-binding dehydrogenase n=1 Tax=Rhodococcus qingshengii TaxID=334542 RepID=UPI000935A1FA|nr:zinc-binding dehydrogenase [Rhodococcus qingshengii]MCZ4548116.1 zinc-binding dehydrogenase [Rhodococcus qingshengii]OKA07943.1 zinc-binding dehydrogenase [Rhodococcus erythropolis]REK75470.1 zinc-binding dehydrogenase [Rhodococcus erythropolis]
MTTMRAQRFYSSTRTYAVEDVPIPVPGPGEVLVKVAYCGICHSDLSLINGTFTTDLPVVTQGHEASGVVAALGSAVSGWAEGDRVVVAAGRSCGHCAACVRGHAIGCASGQIMAFGYDGGWAEYTLAQAAGLTPVPDNVPLDQAALLADAVSTPFGAVVRTGRVEVGEAVGVWGVGGVGTHIVQLARLVGASPIIAFDPHPAVRERSLSLGADYALDPKASGLADTVRERTQGAMLDVAFDSAGFGTTFDQALGCVRRGGRVVTVGMSGDTVSLGTTFEFGASRKSVLGHFGYRNADIATLAKLVSTGRLDLTRSISRIISLEDIATGIEDLEHHNGDPIRILVKP